VHTCLNPGAVSIVTAESLLRREPIRLRACSCPGSVYIITADTLLIGSQSEHLLAYIQGLSI